MILLTPQYRNYSEDQRGHYLGLSDYCTKETNNIKEKGIIEKNDDYFLSPKFTPWYHYKL